MLELGTAKVEITPRFPVPLAGFKTRTGVFERVLTPLFARIFVIKSETAAPVILVSADLIWWGSDRMDSMRRRIHAQSGLEHASILLHATHSHSGPQTSEALSPLIGKASRAYLNFLEDTVLRGIAKAVAALEPVSMERGAAYCGIAIHRRRLIDGTVRMAPNPEGPTDPECTVIRFRDPSSATKALLVHFTCHPTTTADNAVSAEFCGAAMTAIERAFDDSVTAAYLQGCCGDIRPALIRDDQFYRGDAEDVSRLGSELAGAVLRVLNRPMDACRSEPCYSSQIQLPLFFDNAAAPDIPLERESVAMEMTVIRVASNLGFLTFNAEAVVEYGLFVKRRCGSAILPLAYCNGMIGYVTTERQLIEGGYESRQAFRYFGMPGPFVRSTERRVLEAVDGLLRSRTACST